MERNPISCNVVEDLMPLYSEGLCSEDSKALIEAHLKGCENCRRLSEQVPVPEIIPEQEPEQKKVFLKINRKLKRGKLWLILVCVPMAVILYGLGYLTVGQIRKDYHMQSFETIFQSFEVRQIVKSIVKEDFDTYMKYVFYGDYREYRNFGISETEMEAVWISEKERLQASYHAAFGGAKADRIQVKTNYSPDPCSIVTVTFDNGQIMNLQFSKKGNNQYNCYSVGPDNSEERELLRRHMGYLNDYQFVYYPSGWVQSLLTRDVTLDETAAASVSWRFAPEYRETVADSVTAFYENGYAVSDCVFSDLQYDGENTMMFYDVSITASDTQGMAILRTRIYNDMDGWIPPKPEEYIIYQDGCTDALADALRSYFGTG